MMVTREGAPTPLPLTTDVDPYILCCDLDNISINAGFGGGGVQLTIVIMLVYFLNTTNLCFKCLSTCVNLLKGQSTDKNSIKGIFLLYCF